MRYNSGHMEGLIHLITGLGVLAVLFVIFAESGLLIGFFLPGDSLIFTAGFLVNQGILNINIHLFVLLLFIAAALGDSVGYAFGKKVGRRLFERPNSRFFRRDHLEKAEAFFDKYGSKAIILARFVPIVRTFTPIFAGVSKMHYRTFVIFNIVGAAAWTAGFSYLGYFAGKKLTDMGVNIEIMAIIIVFLSLLPIIIPILKNRDHRVRVAEGVKHQWRVMFRRKK